MNSMVTVRVKVVPLAFSELIFKTLSKECSVAFLKDLILEKLSLAGTEIESYITLDGRALHPNQKISSFQFKNNEIVVFFNLEGSAKGSIIRDGAKNELLPDTLMSISPMGAEDNLVKNLNSLPKDTEKCINPETDQNDNTKTIVDCVQNKKNTESPKNGDFEDSKFVDSLLCDADECADEEIEDTVLESAELCYDAPTIPNDNTRQTAATKKQTRATVRYYSRMNPEKVFPLVVLFSDTLFKFPKNELFDQKSSEELTINNKTPVEIEPIIPGCLFFPQRQSVFVSKNTHVAFYLVPLVVGDLKGAVIEIRQGQINLSSIQLDIQVTKRTFALAMAYAAFVMPAFSIGLKFLNLDFDSQKSSEYQDYQKIIKFFFVWLPPWLLFVFFGIIFLVFWFLTKPEQQEEFWTLNHLDPKKLYKEMRLAFARNFDEGWDLLEKLISSYPKYFKGHATYANLHYEASNYREALKGFQKAIELGDASPTTYYLASLCASKIGHNQEACDILCNAKSKLADKKFSPSMSYNLGCYFARLGRIDEAIAEISLAIQKGFSNHKLLSNDPDLKTLRNHNSFKLIMDQIIRP